MIGGGTDADGFAWSSPCGDAFAVGIDHRPSERFEDLLPCHALVVVVPWRERSVGLSTDFLGDVIGFRKFVKHREKVVKRIAFLTGQCWDGVRTAHQDFPLAPRGVAGASRRCHDDEASLAPCLGKDIDSAILTGPAGEFGVARDFTVDAIEPMNAARWRRLDIA